MFTSLLILAVSAKISHANNLQASLDAAKHQAIIQSTERYIKCYDIQDIALIVGKYTKVPSMLISGDPIDEGGVVPLESRDSRANRIVNLLKQFIAPDQWGTYGTYINYWEGVVIVSASKEVHDLIK